MPNLANAALLAVGNIINVEDAPEFYQGKPTGKSEGIKVLIATGDGYAQVKLRHEVANEIKPTIGSRVAWLLRFGANGGGDRDANAWTSFVRPAADEDLASVAAVVRAAKAA